MQISYKNLQEYFDGKLPSPEVLAQALTFHAWEIESIEKVGSDTVLDVKVLPDKSAWALSHRGIAKDLSVILNIPLVHDPLSEKIILEPVANNVHVTLKTPTCQVYTAALIQGVKVGPSPKWLKNTLASLGQKSINNVVDVTNYVMFGLGQPLHAFDAKKLDGLSITVRQAKDGEAFSSLTGESYTLTPHDAVIADGVTDAVLGLAGVKGGKLAEVDTETTDILLESANFDALHIRKTSQRHKLRTDASMRFENGIVPMMAEHGLVHTVQLLIKETGGTLIGYQVSGETKKDPIPVSVTLTKINRVLGLSLSMEDVENIIKRFGYTYVTDRETITVTPPFERPDLIIPEDVIEEIGRIHGYEHVPSVKIEPIPRTEINKRFFYAEAVRDALVALGFSEIFTSSFREKDTVQLANALASDKGYLRSSLRENMNDALAKNAPLSDLFGTDRARLFEIGTVFGDSGEQLALALGARSPSGYKAKSDDPVLQAVCEELQKILGVLGVIKDGIVEIDFGTAVDALPTPLAYQKHEHSKDISYVPFSPYPFLSRDIAFWADESATKEDAESVVREHVGNLAIRITFLDRFQKDGKVSYAFRIVFQSYEKTLTALEADALMQTIGSAVSAKGWEVR